MIKSKKFWVTILIFMVGQAVLYWFLKLFQSNYHYIDCIIDDKIPLVPRFIYIYDLFYPFVFISYYIIFKHDEDVFMKAAIASVIGFLICDVIFLSYPTIIEHGIIPSTDKLTKLVIDVTYFFDSPAINCFPSIHCLYCFQTSYALMKANGVNKKYKIFAVIMLLLIAISTVLVKQHYFYDIIGGLIVCIVVNFINFIFKFDDKLKKIKFFA